MGILRRIFSARSATAPGKEGQRQPPGTASSRIATAAAHDAAGRHAEALAALRPALEAAPNDSALLFARASSLYAAGRYREARDACLRAGALGAEGLDFQHTLGWSCALTGLLPAAEAAMRRVIELAPENWIGPFGMGTVLCESGRHAEALGHFARAVTLQPSSVRCLNALAVCHLDLREVPAAEAALRRVIAVDSGHAVAWSTLATVLVMLDRPAEALEAYRRAESLERDTGAEAMNFVSYGIDLREMGDTRGALALYESHLADAPVPRAHLMYALTLLGAGRYREGWSHLEFRWLNPPLDATRSRSNRPTWSGQDLAGRTLLLRTEQGFGDSIQFLRYAPMLKALGATVFLLTVPEFVPIARQFSGIDRVFASGAVVDFDYTLSLMSLPRVLGTEVGSVPAPLRYLHAPPEHVERWAPRFSARDRPNVGLCWAGSPGHAGDARRSIPFRQLSPLVEVEGVRFFSLQKGPAASELESCARPIVNLGPELADFCDTAAVIEQLDLVIAVDTAVAHLAGALGKPTWVMVAQPADWRWLEEREDSPWYPTLRLFRQRERGDWSGVVARVQAALEAFAAAERGRTPARERQAATPPDRGMPAPAPREGSAPGIAAGLHGAAETRAGILMYRPHDDPVGRSLDWYGEYLQPQLELLAKLVQPGATLLELGAGIGVHAVQLASRLGPEGHLLVSEPRSALQQALRQNLAANGADAGKVTVLVPAVAATGDGSGASTTVDGLQLEQLHLLKIGEGIDGVSVLKGAEETLWRHRPLLFAAAAGDPELRALIARANTLGYRCWRMVVPLHNPGNFNRRDRDIFAGRAALALLALPEEVEVETPFEHCTPVPSAMLAGA